VQDVENAEDRSLIITETVLGCIKNELNFIEYSVIIIRAAQKYNLTTHSITKLRPFDILFNIIKPKLLQQAQEKMLHFHKKDRKVKNYNVGVVIFKKKHEERNKLNSRY